MVFEFLKWRSTFEGYKRGVKVGDLLFKRPHPFFDFTRWKEWLTFLAVLVGGGWISALVGIFAYFIAGGTVLTMMAWVSLFGGGWAIFWFLHLVHSLRFYKIAKVTNVEFVPLSKVRTFGKRLLTIPGELTTTDYTILFSRHIWADVGGEPYRDVSEWVERIDFYQLALDGMPTVGGEGGGPVEEMGDAIGYVCGHAIDKKYLKGRLKEIVDMAGGIPSLREVVKIIQTELVPKYHVELGDRLMLLYCVFLINRPPILPYDKHTTESEMRRVANASDTKEVLNYLKKFAPKIGEV